MALRIDQLEQARRALSALDDRGLVLAYQAGDPLAFPAIYERYRPTARRVAHGIIGNREEAEELAQEAMLRVYQALSRFEGDYNLQSWVIRIASNVALDAARARSRRPMRADAVLEDITAYMPDPAADPQEAVERVLESDLVHEVLASLPAHHRAALVLREFEGRSHLEIADALGITPPQAKALIHRAKESFRRAWQAAQHGVAAIALPLALLVKKIGEKSFALGESLTATATASLQAKVAATAVVAALSGGVTFAVYESVGRPEQPAIAVAASGAETASDDGTGAAAAVDVQPDIEGSVPAMSPEIPVVTDTETTGSDSVAATDDGSADPVTVIADPIAEGISLSFDSDVACDLCGAATVRSDEGTGPVIADGNLTFARTFVIASADGASSLVLVVGGNLTVAEGGIVTVSGILTSGGVTMAEVQPMSYAVEASADGTWTFDLPAIAWSLVPIDGVELSAGLVPTSGTLSGTVSVPADGGSVAVSFDLLAQGL